MLESIPPLRNAPSGTSLISRSRTDSVSSSRTRSTHSASFSGSGAARRTPVLAHVRAAVLPGQVMARRQLGDALEHRQRVRHVLVGQVMMQRFERELARHAAGLEDGLDLRREEDAVLLDAVAERLLPDPVAREEQRPRARVPDREGEHPAKILQAVRALLLVEVEDDFRVGVGAELVSLRDERRAQFLEIVDLAVEDDPDRAVLVRERLMSLGQVNDAQPAMAESDAARPLSPLKSASVATRRHPARDARAPRTCGRCPAGRSRPRCSARRFRRCRTFSVRPSTCALAIMITGFA